MKESTALVATLLRQYRSSCGLTIPNVAQLLKEKFDIEISEKTLYGYENGVSSPKITVFIALCTIYNVGNLSEELGYKTAVSITNDKRSWTADKYDDFFNSTLLEKVYLLLKWGVPDFDGYTEQLATSFPDNADSANFERLYNLFLKMDSNLHESAFFTLEELAAGRLASITFQENQLLKLFRTSNDKTKSSFLALLESFDLLNEHGQEKILGYVDGLVSSNEYIKTASSGLGKEA